MNKRLFCYIIFLMKLNDFKYRFKYKLINLLGIKIHCDGTYEFGRWFFYKENSAAWHMNGLKK